MNTSVEKILHEVKKVIAGKDDVLEKIMMTVLSRGHVLLDDVPSAVVVLPVPPFWLTMAIVVAFFEIFITPASLGRGWFGSGRKAASWWVRCTEKRAGIVSCYESGCCSLQGTSAQNGYGQRSAS